ncbi:myb family transcription factor PHL7-like [Dioscorea cayenensis subsp. rotundata]|uniref:Myb family transcription factor PHL7-like n=1 Tax=Dioscorea cayennensis subsp. rotundata TaxID=55577 RepID=A0AB40CZF9_DIOCR|nr:myb family transcription factor PHL7-like [Dioscorea cayenensis subsp. rotundata]
MEECGVMGSLGKQRMRWSPEMRECFERAVNHLGGPDRATPKGILKAMSVPGLTIAHVKSYLQKYRLSKFVPESSDAGKLASRKFSEILPNFSSTSRVQITEALQLHMGGQLGHANQVQVQKHSKLRIDLQGRYLEKITDEHCDFSSNCKPNKFCYPRKLNPFQKLVESKMNEQENYEAISSFSGIGSPEEEVQISNKRPRMTNYTHQNIIN